MCVFFLNAWFCSGPLMCNKRILEFIAFAQKQQLNWSVCPFQEVDVCKPLGVSLHTVGNGAAPPPAVLPAAAVLPAYSTLPLMPGFLGAPHPAAVAPSPVAHTHAATPDWNTYYYVSKEIFFFSGKTTFLGIFIFRYLPWDNTPQNPSVSFCGSFITSDTVGNSAVDSVDLQRIHVFEIKAKNGPCVTGWIQVQPPFKPKPHKYWNKLPYLSPVFGGKYLLANRFQCFSGKRNKSIVVSNVMYYLINN